MKQIIVVTDGCSNQGMSPVSAAAQAKVAGITVNVIGVVDRNEIGEQGTEEIKAIAKAGGGLHRVVQTGQLARTMQMMTRHTVAATIQGVVNQELKAIFQDEEAGIDSLEPHKRAQVVQSVEEWAETAPIRVALLIDTSASMRTKMDAVREAAADLLLSLRARAGKSELSVLHFPGNNRSAELDTPWTADLANLDNILYKLNVKGTTPTGPALLQAVRYIKDGTLGEDRILNGAWGDYVV